MAILRWVKNLFQRVTADSVSCGTLALWIIAVGGLIFTMNILVQHKL
jgi:hypothetical protein